MVDHDLDTFGKIVDAVLGEVRLDLTTGKATKVWSREALISRLGTDATAFSHWCTGRVLVPIEAAQALLSVLEQSKPSGNDVTEALKTLCVRLCRDAELPRSRYRYSCAKTK